MEGNRIQGIEAGRIRDHIGLEIGGFPVRFDRRSRIRHAILGLPVGQPHRGTDRKLHQFGDIGEFIVVVAQVVGSRLRLGKSAVHLGGQDEVRPGQGSFFHLGLATCEKERSGEGRRQDSYDRLHDAYRI